MRHFYEGNELLPPYTIPVTPGKTTEIVRTFVQRGFGVTSLNTGDMARVTLSPHESLIGIRLLLCLHRSQPLLNFLTRRACETCDITYHEFEEVFALLPDITTCKRVNCLYREKILIINFEGDLELRVSFIQEDQFEEVISSILREIRALHNNLRTNPETTGNGFLLSDNIAQTALRILVEYIRRTHRLMADHTSFT